MRHGAWRRSIGFIWLATASTLAIASFGSDAGANEQFDALIKHFHPNQLPAGFASANGRLESEQVEIATKIPGRIAEVLVKEGEQVEQGQILARMDVSDIQAQPD
jgi:HlyD family secretion protein